jgi:phage baseplate assembly protein W
MMDAGRLFGRGLAFPPRLSADGRLAWSVGADNVREAIRVVLLTRLGERLLLGEFGTTLGDLLFEPNTLATRRLVREQIMVSLRQWEPRVRVESVEVEPDASDPRAATATIHYRLVASQATDQTSMRLQFGA